jgi:hypothetical protein
MPTAARAEEAAVSDRSGSATVHEPSVETPKRSRRIYAAGGLIALSSMALFTVVRSHMRPTKVAPANVLPAAQPEVAATATSIAPPPAQETAIPAASVAPSEPVKSAPPRIERPPAKPATRVVRQAAVDCSFPYILDASGIRKIRPECLK